MKQGQEAWAEMLKAEGIYCKGYGAIPKYAMKDKTISITAKAIYAYFCALSGSGTSTFPSRETILKDLQFTDNVYRLYRKQLLDAGYIEIEKKRVSNQKYDNNVYHLVSNPKRYQDTEDQSAWESRLYGLIRTTGLKAAGYGSIPKTVMCDSRLPLKAKAVYAYFASYTGGGGVAFPKAQMILEDLGITQTTYLKFMRILQACDYIRTKQRNGQSSDGKRGFSVCDYYLIEHPGSEVDSPYIKNTGMRNTSMKNPGVKKPSTTKPSMKKEGTSKSTPPSINTLSNTTPHNYQSIPETTDGWMRLLEENLDFQHFDIMYPQYSIDEVQSLISLMASVCDSSNQTIRIGGQAKSREEVRARFESLQSDHLSYVLECIHNTSSTIHNIRAYYLTSLYNAPDTMDAYYDNQVRQDL